MEDNRPIKSIYSLASPTKGLKDLRLMTSGQSFGNIAKLVNQFGIDVEIVPPPSRLVKRAQKHKKTLKTCYKYSAPRSRLQQFMEKLHFSLTKYSREPYFR